MRWRLHDPAEGPYRWSRAHLVHFQTERALCGVTVAWNAYMVDWEEYLPADAPRCKTCAKRGARQ